VVQNYLQRVVANKSIGNHIFCQGMTFQSDALASAMSMQLKKNIIIPPNPGATGALGIAILANKNLNYHKELTHDITEFKNVTDIKKNSFICKSNSGCSKPGNFCKINKLSYNVKGNLKIMYWGGVCSLWRENSGIENIFSDSRMDVSKIRENYIKELISNLKTKNSQKRVAITDKFQLKELFPFFATFINELGFNIIIEDISNEDALKIGMNNSDVLFCSPMMIYIGIIHSFIEKDVDFIFLPSLIDSQRIGNEKYSKLCPVVQGSSSIISKSFDSNLLERIISPTIEIGLRNLQSNEFLQSCENLSKLLGCGNQKWKNAYETALKSQLDFKKYRQKIGIEAIQYCKLKGITPIVVIGKTYSIYNNILNSGVPGILQSLGALAIPIDCYQGDINTNDFNNIYWSCGHESIRVAKRISSLSGIYALFCTNYGCGPDSFIQHFFQDIMNQKPYMIIDNDVRSGDNGIKTRLEAFWDCISNHRKTVDIALKPFNRNNYLPINISIDDVIRDKTKLLVPYLGPASEVFASALRGTGILAESLPMPDKTAIEFGRLYTSGKECSPMNSTLGSLLMYVKRNSDKYDNFMYFMPGSDGPCRFGMYNILDKIIIDKIGMADKIKILSSGNNNFIQDVPKGLFIIVYIALCIIDSMNWCLHYTRPVEKVKGKSNDIFNNYKNQLTKHLETINGKDILNKDIIFQILSGRLFGCLDILKNAAKEFNAIKKDISIPTVSIDGALYIRCDPFSSNFLIDKLEKAGIRTLPAQFFDWLEFLDYYDDLSKPQNISTKLNQFLKYRIKETTNLILSKELCCPKIPNIKSEINAVKPYLNIKLMSESMLSVGKSIVLKRNREIDSLILVSPYECMQSKIVESFLNIIDKNENLFSKSMQFNNDIIDIETINSLVFEIKKRYKQENNMKSEAVF
jgi:predicted nucleotide-binding protein (sugar kinase/HSP70/actin superfamily)